MSPASLNKPLTLALSKGRIFDETLPLLEAAGVHVTENPESSRKLILPTSDPDLQLIIVRASDVPTYVQYGAADFGIAGKDVLFEHAAIQPGGLQSEEQTSELPSIMRTSYAVFCLTKK